MITSGLPTIRELNVRVGYPANVDPNLASVGVSRNERTRVETEAESPSLKLKLERQLNRARAADLVQRIEAAILAAAA